MISIATARGIALMVAVALIFGAGWVTNGWRLSAQIERQQKQYAEALQQQQESAQAATERLIAERDALDRRHTQEMEDARSENDRLLAAVRSGERRLSVRARCPSVPADGATTGVDDAGTRAELDPAAAERIIALGTDGDEAIRQLNALQDYIRAQQAAAAVEE